MTVYNILFYLLAILLVVSTALAVSRTRLVHTIVYLVISFFTTALLFYLLGAPFLAALEVMIYAGAIMVMFLFMIMTLHLEKPEPEKRTSLRAWLPAIAMGGISLALLAAIMWTGPGHGYSLKPAMAAPKQFGAFIFREFWFPVEVTSFLLFVALAGALYLGRIRRNGQMTHHSEQEKS